MNIHHIGIDRNFLRYFNDVPATESFKLPYFQKNNFHLLFISVW